MIDSITVEELLFLDVETVPMVADFAELPADYQVLWDKKSNYFREEAASAAEVWGRAGIYAEFGRVVCVSVAKYYKTADRPSLRIKSFYGEDEKAILTDLADMLVAYRRKKDYMLCAHNGKEFDFPFLARRMLVHGIKLPDVLNVAGMKPWEVNLLDTLQLWKFGDYKHYTSLDLLTRLFGIPSPKNQMDGSLVADTYYMEGAMDKIVAYCEQDVLAVVQLLLRFKGLPLLTAEQIESLSE